MATAPVEVEIPYLPREWAKPFHASFARFLVLVIHRRAGKTTAVLNHHQRYALDDDLERHRLLWLKPDLTPRELDELLHPPGGRHYGHALPLKTQAKLAAWDMLKHYARVIPGVKFNESELVVRYPTGHKLQLFGADDPDSLRGPAFSGFSFDEYSQHPKNLYSEIVSKALADHLGYAIFLGTLKGKDQLYQTWHAGQQSKDWFALWQDVDHSIATEQGITVQVLERAMADDRQQVAQGLMTQEEYDQEWYLSTEAAIQGAWYIKELRAAKEEGRLTRVPYDPALPVDTDWDLGMDDSTAIWFSQALRTGEMRLIDYHEQSGEGLPYYVKFLQAKPYTYGRHYAPHDIEVRELGTGKSRKEVAATLGLRFLTVPNIGLIEGIQATRLLLSRCWFDETKCAVGIEALRHYRKTFNNRLQEFTGQPVHDLYSHGADALRTLAVRYQTPLDKPRPAWQPMPAQFTG